MHNVLSCLQDGASPLFIASQGGHCDVVDILLKNGANINQAMQVWNIQYVSMYVHVRVTEYTCTYSRTSKERTLWEQAFCPLFGGCPYLGGSLIFRLHHCLIFIMVRMRAR